MTIRTYENLNIELLRFQLKLAILKPLNCENIRCKTKTETKLAMLLYFLRVFLTILHRRND